MKRTLYDYYMDVAIATSRLSYCKRAQVGAVVVTKTGSLFTGYNGTISKYYQNICETPDGVTAPWTTHAEEQCLYKMLKEGVSAQGATLFTTMSCCTTCARMIVCSGVKKVVYLEEYKDTRGIEILQHCEVEVEKYQRIEKESKQNIPTTEDICE